jgi:putative FmdB family regulatory protein
MAEYKFECRACKKLFTFFKRITKRSTTKVQCPGCASTDVEPVRQASVAKTTKKS